MLFSNVVKGQITQSLVKTLFERAGYLVTRLGVEELFAAVIHLDEEQYKALNLPLALRYLPDLLVADQELNQAFLLEVKFRKDFNSFAVNQLYHELKRQRQYWPDSYAIILIANPFVEGGRFHQDYIRIVGPEYLENLNPLGSKDQKKLEIHKHGYNLKGCEFIWNSLQPLNYVFENFGYKEQLDADLITRTLQDLKRL